MASAEIAGRGVARGEEETLCAVTSPQSKIENAATRRREFVIAPDCSAQAVYNRLMRPVFEWKLRSRSLKLGDRTLVMGIVNVTPDSFSDGGLYFDPQRAIEHGLELLAQGADILDIGGESTRPGSTRLVDEAEEKRRVLPVIEGVLRQASDAIVSIDTYKATTARAALARGAEIVNDVSGFTWDEQMRPLLRREPSGCVLMHTRGRPEEWKSLPSLPQREVVPLIVNGLRQLAELAVAAGIERERIVLDPGFGFGKRMDENFPVLAHFGELHALGFPLLSGTSRKSFLRSAPAGNGSAEASAQMAGTLASLTASVLEGAHLVRVHDVEAAVEAVRVADAILGPRPASGS
jgi:dihydropteroate synthase